MLAVNMMLLIAGFVVLIKGADIFVDGSSALARIINVPEVIIGLTIVALGTSAPELAVSTSAVIQSSNEIAISNVTGSNMFNMLGVLGICALIKPLPVFEDILKRDYPLSVMATGLLIIMIGVPTPPISKYISMYNDAGKLSRLSGMILLVIFVIYIILLIVKAIKEPSGEKQMNNKPLPVILIMIAGGIAMIIFGGEIVVNCARSLAKMAGMSETLIGLTIVAIGTSLPELVTSVVAAQKGQTDLAVGNVVGSNLFNILFILGVSASICPIGVNVAAFADICALLFVSVTTYVFAVTNRSINRIEGAFMVMLFIADVIWAIIR